MVEPAGYTSSLGGPGSVDDQQLVAVIKDFLEMGLVDNIVAMFHRYPDYYRWTGAVLEDQRFNVRLGVSVLFEELKQRSPDHTARAVPSLLPLLESEQPLLRGEALSVLGIINSAEARHQIRRLIADPQPQIRELALDILQELEPDSAAGPP